MYFNVLTAKEEASSKVGLSVYFVAKFA